MRCMYPLSRIDHVNFFVCWSSNCSVNFSFGQKKEEAHVARVEHMIPVCVSKNAVLRSMPESTGINGNFPFFLSSHNHTNRNDQNVA